MSFLSALASAVPIPNIQTPFGTFGAGTVAQIIDNISRSRVASHQHALLGDIPFNLVTYMDGMERRISADYAELAVMGGKPRLQFVGDKLDEYTWQIVLHAGFCNPVAEVAKLEGAVRAHTGMPLVFANGDFKGWFVPTELSQTYRASSQDGTPIWLEAQLTLREHVLPPVLVQAAPEPVAAENPGPNGKPKKPFKTKRRTPPKRSRKAPVTRAGKR